MLVSIHANHVRYLNACARRLHGAVSMAERRNKLGQYYTLLWSDPAGAGHGEAELLFQYQQGATASRVKRMVRKFSPADSQGTAEFAVIGEDYFKGGKVLAWKATFSGRAGRAAQLGRQYTPVVRTE